MFPGPFSFLDTSLLFPYPRSHEFQFRSSPIPHTGHGCLPWLFYFWSRRRVSIPHLSITNAVYRAAILRRHEKLNGSEAPKHPPRRHTPSWRATRSPATRVRGRSQPSEGLYPRAVLFEEPDDHDDRQGDPEPAAKRHPGLIVDRLLGSADLLDPFSLTLLVFFCALQELVFAHVHGGIIPNKIGRRGGNCTPIFCMSRRYSAIEIRADWSGSPDLHWPAPVPQTGGTLSSLEPGIFGQAPGTCTPQFLLPRQAARYLTLCLMNFWSGTPDSHRAYACIRNRWGAISPCPWNGRAGEIRTRDFLLPKQAGWPLPYSPACFFESLRYVLKCFVFFEQTAQAIGRSCKLLLLIQ